jgi:hypothetical protein
MSAVLPHPEITPQRPHWLAGRECRRFSHTWKSHRRDRAGWLSGETQVLRALWGLVRDGRLVRLGYGVYARAIISRLSGEPLLSNPTGLRGAAREALTKLGVPWEPTESERVYNEGRSTQIPVNPVLRVKGRFSRRLRDGKTELVLER